MDIPFEFEGRHYNAAEIDKVDEAFWINLPDLLYRASSLKVDALDKVTLWGSVNVRLTTGGKGWVNACDTFPSDVLQRYRDMVRPVRWWWPPGRRKALKDDVAAMLNERLAPHYERLEDELWKTRERFLRKMVDVYEAHPVIVEKRRQEHAEALAVLNRERLNRARVRAEINRATLLQLRRSEKRGRTVAVGSCGFR